MTRAPGRMIDRIEHYTMGGVMSREELKEIIRRVIDTLQSDEDCAPRPACIFSDEPCDVTSFYGMNEEG